MKFIGLAAVTVVGVYYLFGSEADLPNASQIVPVAPAELSQELSERFAKIEARAPYAHFVYGSKSLPVTFKASHDKTSMSMEATAGWRTEKVVLWVKPGPTPAESQLDAFFSSYKLDGLGPKDDLRTKVDRILTGTISDLERGDTAEMLLGSSNPRVNHTMPDSSITIDPRSARPMVDTKQRF